MPEGQKGIAVKDRADFKPKKPRRYNVLLHNDDFTPMEFVVYVLRNTFRQPESKAIMTMLSIHNQGVGVAGMYTREIAETKMYQVEQVAKQSDWPLMASIEPVDGDDDE